LHFDHPEAIAVFVKPQSALGYAEAVERRLGKTRQIVFHAPETSKEQSPRLSPPLSGPE
jgi:hypothetical protein